MKTSQLLFTLFILFVTAASSLTQANTTTVSLLEKCKAKPKHAVCYQAELSETFSSDKTISIDVHFWEAAGELLNPYPIVWLNGGPGMTNLEPPMPDWVWEHFNVLAIGYRGIDGTPRLDCPTLRKQLGIEDKNSKDDFLSSTTLDRLTEKVTECQQNWEALGVDTQAYGIYEVIEDIDRVRQALGFEKINLLSASYGTRIAWYFDQLKPGVVDRNLIMSGNPDGGFFFDPFRTDAQLLELEKLCNQDAECFQKLPNLTQTITSVLSNLPDKAWGVRLDADQIRLVTFMMLYSRQSIPMVIDAYSKASNGNQSGLAAMQKFPNPLKSEDWVWGAFFSAGAIDIGELETFQAQLAAAESSTVLNAPLSELLYRGITRSWQARGYQPLENRISQTPTLILASTLDIATPIERVESFWMPYVANGALINVEGAGHAPDHLMAGGDEINLHMMQFLAAGEAATEQSFGKPFEFESGFSLSWITYGFWGLIGSIGAGLFVAAIVIL